MKPLPYKTAVSTIGRAMAILITLVRLIERTPFVLVKVNAGKRHTIAGDFPEGVFLIIEADDDAGEIIVLKPGTEAMDARKVAGIGQQNRLTFFIKPIVRNNKMSPRGQVIFHEIIQRSSFFV